MADLAAALDYSPALRRFQRRREEDVEAVRADPCLGRTKPGHVFASEAAAMANEHGVEPGLRRYRNRELLRILAADLDGAAFEQIAGEISELAAACLEAAIGSQPAFSVLGMGKLGGRELNYSSDIDVVFLYASDEGTAPDGRTPHAYYDQLATSLARTLGHPTEEGIVFRVDLDLRPEGKSGPSVSSLASARTYYENWGQTWERFAMLRARPVAGNIELGREFLSTIEPFVYRRTLDYSTLETIRDMKRRINSQAAARDARRHAAAGFDLKLGRGGIRELEFVVQTLQLLNAGRHPSVRQVGTIPALKALADEGLIPSTEAEAMADAYRFLRTLEHRVQAVELAQTHQLPTDAEELERIGATLDGDLEELLDRHRGCVIEVFDELFADPVAEQSEAPETALLFDEQLDEQTEQQLVSRLNVSDLAAAVRTLRSIRTFPRGRAAERGARYLRRMAPAVLDELRQAADPDAALRNLEAFLSRIGAWTTLLALLAENPATTRTLVRLFGASDHLSQLFIARPELLDELVRMGSAASYKNRATIRRELHSMLEDVDELEDRLDAIRRWRNAEVLRLGLADLSGELDVVNVNLQLSQVADACVGAAAGSAWAELGGSWSPGEIVEGFLVLAMGGLGGRELAFASDLDLIFFYDPSRLAPLGRSASETGSRLGQRIITALSAPTREGIAFRVDLRLRPSGTSGPLVTTPEAFQSYHADGTEIWERLALVRARPCWGDARMWRSLRGVLDAAVRRPSPDRAEITSQVRHMRARLEKEIAREKGAKYNLKTGFGGLVDIEFLVQYLQLAEISDPPIPRTSHTLTSIRRLRTAGQLTDADAQTLISGYRLLRLLENRLRIVRERPVSELPREAEPAGRLAHRCGLHTDKSFEDAGRALLDEYESCTRSVRRVFDTVVS